MSIKTRPAPLKFSAQDYLGFDPCEGDRDVSVSLRRVRLVRARKSHACFLGGGYSGDNHTIQTGDLYRMETALVDGDHWGKYAVCVPCMDKWLTEVGAMPVDPQTCER